MFGKFHYLGGWFLLCCGACSSETAKPTVQPKGPALQNEISLPKMVAIPAGTFRMGLELRSNGSREADDTIPAHDVTLNAFSIAETEITNAQFRTFVDETGFKTEAEMPTIKNPQTNQLYPAGSIVFTPPEMPVPLTNVQNWQSFVRGASWRNPEGPGSKLDGRENHPVVHVCFEDAMAYCKWLSKRTGKNYRLSTEAEWEYAARGGQKPTEFIWGDELTVDGQYMANTWQGTFPHENTREDGFVTTAPVKSFPANAFGLYDMAGNVWEWCNDWYRPDYYKTSPKENPQGPRESDSFDPIEPGMAKRVQRGGSFLCAENYCKRFRPSGRGKGDPYSAASHLGFRVVCD